MKINLSIICLLSLIFVSCKKNDSSSTTTPSADNYITTSGGSSWNYHLIDSSTSVPVSSNYTLTSTTRDSSINGKNYHVFTNSTGGNQYQYLSGHDYYEYDSLAVAANLNANAIERLYLKDDAALGATWSQNMNVSVPGSQIPVPFTISNSITEKGIQRTVNGISYSNVIHVSTAISSPFIPSASLVTSINSYYAPKFGLIENSNVIHLNFAGIVVDVKTTTTLMSATLK
ncbi:MAG: hypothetical protein M3Z92_08485 [Bacteroidota bacterium]|nr:hypothetical protein [Bacteroidota bacterium]